MNHRVVSRWFAALAALTLFLVGCYTVPETGRRAFIALPVGQELALGISAFDQIKQQEKLSTNPQKTAMVQRVGERIAAVVGNDLPSAEWEFALFASDQVNAFALPGGKIGVYEGILRLASTEDELATVIGHEIAHVTARHGAERFTQAVGLTAVGVGLDAALSGRDPQTRQLAMAAYGLGATVGLVLPHGRSAEREADEIGIIYAARAGYDPRAAISFWQKMEAEAAKGTRPPEFLSTHPSGETRIRELQRVMPRALEIYQQARR
jgi:metalloendopeptidase OMA1, mitochondrial